MAHLHLVACKIGFRSISNIVGDTQPKMDLWEEIHIFVVDVLLRQLYLHLLFRLPSSYFSRVYRVFKDATLSLVEIKDMGLRVVAEDVKVLQVHIANLERGPSPLEILPPAYVKLKERWEALTDGLLEEWKTLNIISGLLVTQVNRQPSTWNIFLIVLYRGILTVLQIPSALDDPVIRYLALWSLLSALLTLLYGCLFIA